MKNLLLTLFILEASFGLKIYKNLTGVCTNLKKKGNKSKFVEFPDMKAVDWDVQSAFDKKIFLGNGTFGVVHQGKYTTSENLPIDVAIKKIVPKDKSLYDPLLVEISSNIVMNKYPQFAKVFGCSYSNRFDHDENESPEESVLTNQIGKHIINVVRPQSVGKRIENRVVNVPLTNQFENYDQRNRPFNIPAAVHLQTPNNPYRAYLQTPTYQYRMLGPEEDIAQKEKSDLTFTQIFIVQELLDFDLKSKKFKPYLKDFTLKDALKLWLQLAEGLQNMWNEGMSHNDIKPDNVMLKNKCQEIKIIDLGMVWLWKTPLTFSGGSPVFMSPVMYDQAKSIVPLFLKQKDDLYSYALTIADVESEGFRDLFGFDQQGKPIETDCYLKSKTPKCISRITANVKDVLEKKGYGSFDDKKTSEDNINFTTLLALLSEYHGRDIEYDFVIHVIKRLIKEEEAKNKSKEQFRETKTALNPKEAQTVKKNKKEIEKLQEEFQKNADAKLRAKERFDYYSQKLKELEKSDPRTQNRKNDIDVCKDGVARYTQILNKLANEYEQLLKIKQKIDLELIGNDVEAQAKEQQQRNAFQQKRVQNDQKNVLDVLDEQAKKDNLNLQVHPKTEAPQVRKSLTLGEVVFKRVLEKCEEFKKIEEKKADKYTMYQVDYNYKRCKESAHTAKSFSESIDKTKKEFEKLGSGGVEKIKQMEENDNQTMFKNFKTRLEDCTSFEEMNSYIITLEFKEKNFKKYLEAYQRDLNLKMILNPEANANKEAIKNAYNNEANPNKENPQQKQETKKIEETPKQQDYEKSDKGKLIYLPKEYEPRNIKEILAKYDKKYGKLDTENKKDVFHLRAQSHDLNQPLKRALGTDPSLSNMKDEKLDFDQLKKHDRGSRGLIVAERMKLIR